MREKITLLYLVINDNRALLAGYMPFVKEGGLFVPTSKRTPLGSDVFLILHFPQQNETLTTTGRVIWVRTDSVQGLRKPGIGIQFSGSLIDNAAILERLRGDEPQGNPVPRVNF